MHSLNLALKTGRFLQRKQTGFIHLCYESEDLLTHDTIPILENALFALALFRTRMTDQVLEGKALIEKLLKFEVEGNFPIYLHQFPKMEDPYLGLRIIPILFWILADFSSVIGGLKKELEECMHRIVLKAHLLPILPQWAKGRLLALEGKIGAPPQKLQEWEEMLISLQMAEKKGADAGVTDLLEQACSLWHQELFLYIGPCLRRQQQGGEVEPSLFDLFLSEWQNRFSSRDLHKVDLFGALIRPLSFTPSFEKRIGPYIRFDQEAECPFFMAWKGEEITHTFVLAKRHLRVEGNGEKLTLQYPEELPESDEKSFELNFFLNHHEDHAIFVNGKKATLFHLGDQVEIRSRGVNIQLLFSAEEGAFVGHIMRGNRPSQKSCKGENRFAAYDWRLLLRTLERPIHTSIQVQILVQQTPESQPLFPLHASHCLHTESCP